MVRVRSRDGGVQELLGVAPVAMQQGRYAAKLVRARLSGHPIGPFRYLDKGNLATIGRARAVADLHAIRLSGFPAWARLAGRAPLLPHRLPEPADRPHALVHQLRHPRPWDAAHHEHPYHRTGRRSRDSRHEGCSSEPSHDEVSGGLEGRCRPGTGRSTNASAQGLAKPRRRHLAARGSQRLSAWVPIGCLKPRELPGKAGESQDDTHIRETRRLQGILRPSGKHISCLPCRRSWVRIPSAASKRPAFAGLFRGRSRLVRLHPVGLSPDSRSADRRRLQGKRRVLQADSRSSEPKCFCGPTDCQAFDSRARYVRAALAEENEDLRRVGDPVRRLRAPCSRRVSDGTRTLDRRDQQLAAVGFVGPVLALRAHSRGRTCR